MRWIAIGGMIMALGCQSEPPAPVADTATSDSPSRTTGDSVSPSTATPPVAAQEKNVRLEEPSGTIRGNPVKVRGEARTFENNVVIRLLDERGQKMVETFTTASGEMGKFSAFEKDVFLVRDPGKELTVEAFEYSAKDGSIVNRDSVTWPVELRLQKVTLQFPSARRSPNDCTKMFPEERPIPVSTSLARLLVEALIAGPVSGDFDNPFPAGSQVRSINLRDGVLTVDFNERLANVGGSCAATAIRASVERTLGQLPNVRRVVITAMGDEKTALQP